MNIKVIRKEFTDKSTIGELHINDVFECYTLEDRYRPDGTKVPHETCIPMGTYPVVIDFSNRFQRKMPHILNVPKFDGIRIHSGNKADDTEGCILVGQTKSTDFIGGSRLAFAALFPKMLAAATRSEPITIEILSWTPKVPA